MRGAGLSSRRGGTGGLRRSEHHFPGIFENAGIGMAAERVPTPFNAFEQASTGPDRSPEGSGLGLAIVDHLVGEMGGAIAVATEKGVGTCFTVRFPTDDSVAGESAE